MMERLVQTPRPDWRQRCEALGFGFHSIDGLYWKESVAYRYSAAQIDRIEDVADELHAMCMDWVDDVVRRGDWHDLPVDERAIGHIEQSWRRREDGLLGRFDFSWDGRGQPKLLEYNADTPTSLIESSLVQWDWKQGVHPEADQFNALHESLVARWRTLLPQGAGGRITFLGHYEQEEDAVHLDYLLDTALQAGWVCQWLPMSDLGWDGVGFVDAEGAAVDTAFKLYPWEWMWRDGFAAHIPRSATRWIEPAWKQLLSTKAMLVHLWRRHPDHPNLLPAAWLPEQLPGQGAYVRKPLFSREGAGTCLLDANGVLQDNVPDAEPAGGWMVQSQSPLPCYGGFWTVTGVWMVGDKSSGLCLREDISPITQNSSHFVPHFFD